MIVINPIMGGGLSLAKLAAATATPEDVLAGKKFYSGSKELQIGTLVPASYKSGSVTIPLHGYTTAVTVGFTPDFVIGINKDSTMNNSFFLGGSTFPTFGRVGGYCYTYGGTITSTGFELWAGSSSSFVSTLQSYDYHCFKFT